QGGARLQFSMLPMNLLRGHSAPASYIITGSWGNSALKEAKREGAVEIAWDGAEHRYDRLPADDELQIRNDAAYVHITSNETIEGVQFLREPNVGQAPLVADCSSDFLCRPLPVEKYGVIYACAQKNAGPAGLTIVVMRKDLLTRGGDDLPGYLNYRSHAEADSMWNTPPTFAIYMFDLVAKWLQDDIGGLANMEARNRKQAQMLYDVVDGAGGFYRPHARPDCRSIMNVTFRLPSDELQKKFLEGAREHKLDGLKGHRSVGGIRASIYNAQPDEGAAALCNFMRDFCQQNG
ncbi:MAG: 3-phosphoserine/phosphohydroxythreonine transaminase, partial [Planctomycetales bacterium]|nr:3-phosphoserine/phosphohydroxythreonine transaminase [Planctomycetales bacterium]